MELASLRLELVNLSLLKKSCCSGHNQYVRHVTVNICDVDFTLFVCEGKLDRKLEESDYGNCEIVEQYKNPETIPFNK